MLSAIRFTFLLIPSDPPQFGFFRRPSFPLLLLLVLLGVGKTSIESAVGLSSDRKGGLLYFPGRRRIDMYDALFAVGKLAEP